MSRDTVLSDGGNSLYFRHRVETKREITALLYHQPGDTVSACIGIQTLAAPRRAWPQLCILAMLFFSLLIPRTAAAQQPEGESSDLATARAKFATIQWSHGPITGHLGSTAQIEVPATCRLTESAGARTFLELTHNIPSGDEIGALYCEDRSTSDGHWFVIYTYDPSGYVRDDEKGTLDSGAILASIRRATEESNRELRARGWDEMTVEGWVRTPHYDERTHNLTWSFTGRSSRGDEVVNHSVRLLGRSGVLHADLVLAPNQLETAVADFDQVVAGTSFLPGSRYSEWRDGDKVAAYGLTALVAGGAGAVAAKTGLFAKLGKLLIGLAVALWKVLVAAAIGFLAMLKSLFKRKPKNNSASSSDS